MHIVTQTFLWWRPLDTHSTLCNSALTSSYALLQSPPCWSALSRRVRLQTIPQLLMTCRFAKLSADKTWIPHRPSAQSFVQSTLCVRQCVLTRAFLIGGEVPSGGFVHIRIRRTNYELRLHPERCSCSSCSGVKSTAEDDMGHMGTTHSESVGALYV